MSVLEAPRIVFRGEVTWDPIVTNNHAHYYDETDGETVFPTQTDKVAAFRTQAIDEMVAEHNWNPHGTHRSLFENTTVTGAVLAAGPVTAGDPFLAAAVSFAGMLVDLEPYGSFSSQLFFDSVTFGVAGGYAIELPRAYRMTARYINFARSSANTMIAGVASAVWQTSFEKTSLKIGAFDSPILAAFQQALAADDVRGLTIRFNTYDTIYFDDNTLTSKTADPSFAALQTKLRAGGFQPNPARSQLVGVLGLWRTGEPWHEPGDRALCYAPTSALATAHARLATDRLVIDLANSVPEVNRDLTKQDLGTLNVTTVDPATGASTALGSIAYAQYDRAAYEAWAGIVELPLTVPQYSAAHRGDLQIANVAGTAQLTERVERAIPLVPNAYLDEGDHATAAFQIYSRGTPVRLAMPVTLWTMSADGGTVTATQTVTSDTHGVVELPLGTQAPGVVAVVASPGGVDPPGSGGIDPQLNTYAYVRTRPTDDATGALPPTWANVYAILANWNALAPCMDNWLRLDDPAQIHAYASMLRRLTDPAAFESFRFMPVTRDMTKGERTLLWKFLAAPAPAPHTRLAAESAATMPTNAARSRSLRRP